MGANLDNSGGSRSRSRRLRPMSEINVTPFVDVMLVLLIVFMVTAPFLTVGIEIDMPDTVARNLPADEEPLTITIQADGVIYLQETEVELDEIVPRLLAISEAGYDSRIFIRSDGAADWNVIAPVMANISEAGFTRLGLVTDPVER